MGDIPVRGLKGLAFAMLQAIFCHRIGQMGR